MKTVTRRSALWQADLDAGVCAAPEECVDALLGRDDIVVHLEHREHGLTARSEVFTASLRQDVEWQFAGLTWPAELRPGVLVTAGWNPAKHEVTVRTTALDEPLRIDGVDYFHEYDPKVVTREFVPGPSNRGKVLHAVRKQGRVFEDGSAVLPEEQVARLAGLARGARNAFLLRNAVDQLIREGYLTRVPGSVDKAGYPTYPAVDAQKATEMLFYAPMVEPAPYPGEEEDEEGEGHDRREHMVNGFVRKLPPGARPSERQVRLHEQVESTDPLEPGYTFVKQHHRGKS